MGSGWIWFVAGFAFNEIVRRALLDDIFMGSVAILSSIVGFLGAVGTGALLAITAVAFWLLARSGAENKRARWDMKRTWNNRKQYR